MNRIPYTRALGIAVMMCLASAWAVASDTVVEEIIARVNDQIITRSDLHRSREQMLNEMHQQNIPERDPREVEAENNLLRDLIDQQLLVQKGAELGITADTELIKRLDELRKQMNLDSMEALEKAAQQQGVSFEEFKQNMRNGIITQKVIQSEVGGHINITPDDVKHYYEEHRAELEQPEQVRLSEILVTPEAKAGEEPSAEAVAAAQQKAEQALADVKSGKSFSEVAQKYSNGPTAAQGGDLGFFKRGMLAGELENKTFAMKAGETTGVTRTKQGFVVLRVDEHRDAGMPALKSVEAQITEQIYYQRLQPALRAYLTKLRENAFIDIKLGYIDSGASPNQTKPVLTNSALPPGANAKPKKKKKFGLF